MTSGFQLLTEAQLRARGTAKWTRFADDVLPMWVAEMDFTTAAPIVEAITDHVRRQVFGYPSLRSGLADAFAGYAREHWSLDVNPAWLRVVADTTRGVEVGIEAFSPAGSPVIVPSPAYMPFWEIPPVLGREAISVPMLRDDRGRWTLDLPGIDAAFAAGARCMILCQPFNPLGRVFDADELRALTEVVDRHGAWVISDEIHAPLVFEGESVPYAATSEAAAAHTVTVTSASKAWNIPGLRTAWVLPHTEDAQATFTRNVSPYKLSGFSSLGPTANEVALREGQPWLDEAKAQIKANIDWLDAYARREWDGVGFTPMEGTYLAWLDFTALGLPGDPMAWLLNNARVGLSAGPTFGPGGEGCARMNLATSPEILQDACDRITRALAAR